MSEFPKFEKGPEETPEQRYQRCLEKVSQLFEQGASEQERIDAIRQWQDKEWELDDIEKNKPESKGMPRNREKEIRHAIRTAEVKWAAGFQDDAWGDFYDAINSAVGAKRDDIADEVRERMRELDSQ